MTNSSHRPPRLTTVFQHYQPPLYFVTLCTLNRDSILACEQACEGFRSYARVGTTYGFGVGNYVLMPDHVHLFVRVAGEQTLGVWIKGLKRAIGNALCSSRSPSGALPIVGSTANSSVWQPGFFDHLVRSNESYVEKWVYVRDNPVRKGLVDKWEDWPYSGEIVTISEI